MVIEQQKQLSLEADIHTLAIHYFENAYIELFYEKGLAVEPLNDEFRQVSEEHSANKDEYYKQLVQKVLGCLMDPDGEISFDEIINKYIDPHHGSVRSFEEHGGSFSVWLHQLKSDTINTLVAYTKLIADKDIEERKSMVQDSIAKVLSDDEV